MRCKSLYIILLFALISLPDVVAQEMSTLFLRENPRDEYYHEITSDTILFYRPLAGGAPIFDELTEFGLGFVSYSPRGRDDRAEHYLVDGVELPYLLNSQQDYIFIANLRRVAVERPYYGRGEGREEYLIDASARSQLHSVRVGYGERRFRTNLRLLSTGGVGEWRYSVAVDGRTGRDANVEGLFGNTLGTLISLERDGVAGGLLSFSLLGSAGEQSIRGWSSEEVYHLTGNNLYNPYWGYFDGEVRSSRLRRSATPLLRGVYTRSGESGDWRVSTLLMAGERSVSGLQWVDAMNPTPDYYTYLPSYHADSDDSSALSELWRGGNTDYTQIRWDNFWFINSLSPDGRAVYLIEQAVERPLMAVVDFENSRIISSRVSLDWGGELRSESSHYFKRVEDLLGAEWTDNRDGFLIDDVSYSKRTENDIQNPDRIVREGDMYGYNYHLHSLSAALRGGVVYSYNRLSASAEGELSVGSMWREGVYEKATFVGSRSFGKSAKSDYTAWSISANGAYTLSPSSTLRLSFLHRAEPTVAGALFYDARYSNDLIDSDMLNRRFDLSADYSLRGRVASLDVATFYNTLSESHNNSHYYDDLSSTYVDFTMRDVRSRRMGVEAALSLTLSPRLDVVVAGSVSSFRYMNNPLGELRRNADGEVLLTDERILLRGYVPISTPQYTAAARISYSAPWSWWINAEWFWAGGRFMELSPMRRSERVIAAASTPEARKELIEQCSLGSGSQLNLFVYRSFELGTHSVAFSVSVNNLLNSNDLLYGGYEPSRLRKQGSALARTITPHAPKVSYINPRTLSATITYEF